MQTAVVDASVRLANSLTERDKKKKQDLADRIFGQRRSSAPAAGVVGARKPPTGPKSLGSRINGGPTGVSKVMRFSRLQESV